MSYDTSVVRPSDDIRIYDAEGSSANDVIHPAQIAQNQEGPSASDLEKLLDAESGFSISDARPESPKSSGPIFFSRLADVICKWHGKGAPDETRTFPSQQTVRDSLTSGVLKLLAMRPADALTSLCRAGGFPLESQEDEARLYLSIAEVYYEQGMLEDAANAYFMAASLDVALAYADVIHERLFDIGVRLRDWPLAEYAMECWLQVEPGAKYREGLSFAKIRFFRGDYEGALEFLSAAYQWESERADKDIARRDELLFWKSMTYLNLEDFPEAAASITEMRGFGMTDVSGTPLNVHLATAWFCYLIWKAKGDVSMMMSLPASLEDVNAGQLIYLTTMSPTPVDAKQLARFFDDALGLYHEGFLKLGDREDEGAKLDYLQAFGKTASLMARYYGDCCDHLKAAGGNQDCESALGLFLRSSRFGREQLLKMLQDAAVFSTEFPMTRKLSADREGEINRLASDVIISSLKFFPDLIDLGVKYSQVIRRSSEMPDKRYLSVEFMEELVGNHGMPEGEFEKAVMIERGLVWREYLEGLIHEFGGNGDFIDKAYEDAKAYMERVPENDPTDRQGRLDLVIDAAYTQAKKHLEAAAGKFPEDPETWLNLAWLYYTWGKWEKNDFRDAIYFSEAVLDKFEGKNVAGIKAVGIDPDLVDIFLSSSPKPTMQEIAEIKRVLGWSESRQADKDINFSDFDDAKRLLNSAIGYGNRTIGEAANRREARDAVYLKAYSQYLLCKVENKNRFKAEAPGPDNINKGIKLEPQNTIALMRCEDAFRYVLDEIYHKEQEHVGSEVFYSLGLIQAERYDLGGIRRFYRNSLFHADVAEGTYYADLLKFISMLAPEPAPPPLLGDQVDEHLYDVEGMSKKTIAEIQLASLHKKMANMERQQIEGFGAIEDLLMAFKKDELATRKQRIAREALINALAYQISFTEMGGVSPRDKENNLMLMIRLLIDCVKEQEHSIHVQPLKEYLKIAIEWGLAQNRPEPMNYLLAEAAKLGLNGVEGILR